MKHKEYIERGALLNSVIDGKRYPDNICLSENDVVKVIKAQDALSVEPIIWANWLDTQYYGSHHEHIIECSHCGDQIEELKLRKALKRCPNCGAHMGSKYYV